jgi:hypothetical protein
MASDGHIPIYQFEPLSGPDQIRILQLHSAKGGYLECSIKHIPYSQKGYEALSYVWGSGERPYRAIIRDESGQTQGYIPLTLNLRDALRDLRDAKEVDRNIFWIDQICINQNSTQERNQQVKLMGQIYGNADRVITYIGPSSPQEQEARGLSLLQAINDHFAPNVEFLTDGDIYLQRDASKLPVRSLPFHLKATQDAEWAWLIELCWGPWTSRLWMVQEQILNPNLVCLRGSRLLSWESVIVIPHLYWMHLLPEAPLFKFLREKQSGGKFYEWSASNCLHMIWRSRQMRWPLPLPHSSNRKRQSMDTSLLPNMIWLGDLNCLDPRDKIYAVLAISTGNAVLEIIPDYSETNTITQTYIDASKAILKHASDLTMLMNACWWDNTSLDYPSWALNIPRTAEKLSDYVPPGQYTPHPRIELDRIPIIHKNVLPINGRILDTIMFTTKTIYLTLSFRSGIADAEYVKTLAGTMSACMEVLQHVGVTVDTVAATCKVITNRESWEKPLQDVTQEMVEQFTYFWFYQLHTLVYMTTSLSIKMDAEITEYSKLLNEIKALSNMPNLDFLTTEQQTEAQLLFGQAFTRGRSLCVTEQHRITSGQNEVHKGDVVAAFQGANVLFILREVGDSGQYRLIGDAKVDGLMHGEAYEGLDPDEVDYEIQIV